MMIEMVSHVAHSALQLVVWVPKKKMVQISWDISTDVDRFIRALAESRALYLSRKAGRPLLDN